MAVATANGSRRCSVEGLDGVHGVSSLGSRSRLNQPLAHMPAMAHANRLAGERVSFERSEKQGDFGDVLYRGELLVDGLAEQDFLHHAFLGDAELLGLL